MCHLIKRSDYNTVICWTWHVGLRTSGKRIVHTNSRQTKIVFTSHLVQLSESTHRYPSDFTLDNETQYSFTVLTCTRSAPGFDFGINPQSLIESGGVWRNEGQRGWGLDIVAFLLESYFWERLWRNTQRGEEDMILLQGRLFIEVIFRTVALFPLTCGTGHST